MENSFVVYKHTCPNNKVYIGITKVNPIKRWRKGEGYVNNAHFYRAIHKYGWDSIKHEIICSELTEDEAKKVEIALISAYNSANPLYGYNQTLGGDYRCKMPEESRLCMIEKLKGRPLSEEHLEHLREGIKSRAKREHLSEEHRANIAKSLIGNKRALGNIANRIKVAQYTLDGVFIRHFDCSRLAAEEIGCAASGINKCCKENASGDLENTKYKGKYKGFRWYYV